jgi:hypothetical protein
MKEKTMDIYEQIELCIQNKYMSIVEISSSLSINRNIIQTKINVMRKWNEVDIRKRPNIKCKGVKPFEYRLKLN